MDAILAPHGLAAAAALLLLAGLADSLGDRAVVLLINRITPRAFAFSLLASALLFAAGAALWIWGAWLAATRIFGIRDTLAHFFAVLSFAFTPFVFSALALLPLLGPAIHWVLRLLSFLAGLGLLVLLELTPGQALLCTVCGALLVLGVNWLFSEPAASVARRLWAALTGHPRPLRTHLPRAIPGYEPGHTAGHVADGQVE
jgi:hypothetical protein